MKKISNYLTVSSHWKSGDSSVYYTSETNINIFIIKSLMQIHPCKVKKNGRKKTYVSALAHRSSKLKHALLIVEMSLQTFDLQFVLNRMRNNLAEMHLSLFTDTVGLNEPPTGKNQRCGF